MTVPRRSLPASFGGRRFGKAVMRGSIAVSVLFFLISGMAITACSKPAPYTCERNLKQLGLVCVMFAYDSKGSYFPELSSKGPLTFSLDAQGEPFLEYFVDPSLLFCPKSGNGLGLPISSSQVKNIQTCLDRGDYFYIGYALTSDEDVRAYAAACDERRKQGLRFNQDLVVDSGRKTFYRLCIGVERKILPGGSEPELEELAKKIPVFIERPGHHKSRLTGRVLLGGNVGFLDGHVEWRSAGKWPYTDTTIQLLSQFK